MSEITSSSTTKIKRLPEKARTDVKTLHAVLDAGIVAHVGVVDHGQPIVIPVGYARDHNTLLIHGSSASRLFKLLDSGAPACVTVTLLDGLVLARSLFESSINYRCVMVFGTATRLKGQAEVDALKVVTEHLVPGRWDDARQPTAKELKATMTLSLSLEESSVKISEGPPEDLDEDLESDAGKAIWAGHIPIFEQLGVPIPDQFVPNGTPIPDYMRTWKR
ncbi:MAG: pyridoxamine 5'-phosphate oxidase family protein [Actinomycetia bacterium]|nr:pyridoxamine 5'-phosphate oxidase family protein [Actinomycetes bacterium]